MITVPVKVLGFVGYQNKNTNFFKKIPEVCELGVDHCLVELGLRGRGKGSLQT